MFIFSCGGKSKVNDPDFSVVVNVGTGKVSYDLTIGFSPKGTDGYDHGVDRYAPPPPPPVFFDAALWWDGTEILPVAASPAATRASAARLRSRAPAAPRQLQPRWG